MENPRYIKFEDKVLLIPYCDFELLCQMSKDARTEMLSYITKYDSQIQSRGWKLININKF